MTPSFLSAVPIHVGRKGRQGGSDLNWSAIGTAKSQLCRNDRCENPCFLSISHEPGIVLRAGRVNLTITLGGRDYLCTCFIDGKTEPQKADLAGTPESLALPRSTPTPQLSLSSSSSLYSGAPGILFLHPSPAPRVPVRAWREGQYKVQPLLPGKHVYLTLEPDGLPMASLLPLATGITLLSNPPSLPSPFPLERERAQSPAQPGLRGSN